MTVSVLGGRVTGRVAQPMTVSVLGDRVAQPMTVSVLAKLHKL